MYKLVILDVDGVLINGDKFSNELPKLYKVDKQKEKEFFTGIFQQCLLGKEDLKVAIAPYLAGFGWPGTVDELLDFWFKTESNINKPLIDLVSKLRRGGTKVVVATNNELHRTNYMLDELGFAKIFDKVYSSATVGHKKPYQEFYKHILTDQKVSANDAVFWDDDQSNIDGAKHYGIDAYIYNDVQTVEALLNRKPYEYLS